MTASPSIDPEVFLHEQLAQASPGGLDQSSSTAASSASRRKVVFLTFFASSHARDLLGHLMSFPASCASAPGPKTPFD